MPTPFMHLDFAERLRAHPELSRPVRQQLEQAWSAFYLGNVAADYQTVCDIPREQTHFYPLPPRRDEEAYQVMLASHPELADPLHLPPEQAVFVAGYCFHLIQDLIWFWEVLIPYFVESETWPPERRVRFISHNTLLTYLDRRAYLGLPRDAYRILQAAHSQEWLPFARDADLHRWRDLLAEQLLPDTEPQTAAIYAERLHMSAAEFEGNLNNPDWMQANIFDKVPLPEVEYALEKGITRAVQFTNAYLAPVASLA